MPEFKAFDTKGKFQKVSIKIPNKVMRFCFILQKNQATLNKSIPSYLVGLEV